MRFPRAVGALVLALCPATAGLASELPTNHSGRLSDQRLSTSRDGDLVIALQAHGDLRGLFTLTVHSDGDGSITGQWSLVSAYFQDVDEDGNPFEIEAADPDQERQTISAEHHDPATPDLERIKYVNLGTIGGTVNGGRLVIGADGAVTAVEHVQLTIVSSTLTFEGAAGGGSMDWPALHDGGSLNLTF
jgi:hypothetical protein